ncbi:MAG: hypothetical protein WBO54_04880 [Thermoanaerobaculia bacterium]
MEHRNFWWEFAGKVGVPVFAATLVGCLLEGDFSLLHAILMAMGLAMMGLSHWQEHHRDGGP